MLSVKQCEIQTEWDDEILSRDGHPLQLWGWGEVKAAHNWRVARVFIYEDDTIIGAAQLLIRKLPFPFTAMVYIPRGPVATEEARGDVLEILSGYVKEKYKAVVLTVEPDWLEMPPLADWQQTTNTVLVPRTVILDLERSEDELMAAMAKKTRQYIRKSMAEAIQIRRVTKKDDLEACLAIYKETAERADFGLHNDEYYYDIFDKLGDHSPVFAAFVGDRPVCFLWLAISSATAFELYGGMNEEGQHLRANYALKWHAITLMKKWGIERYDMNGLLNDGVSTFKQGFASHETQLVGAYDKALSPLYGAWKRGLPAAKKIVQKMKNR